MSTEERKDVTIYAPVARSGASAPAAFRNRTPFEQIMMKMLHNCPLCHDTFVWDDFVAHAEGCVRDHGFALNNPGS